MTDKEHQESLDTLHERLTGFIDRYNEDRVECRERYQDEQKERDKWRIGIENKIDSLHEKVNPVVRDHQIVVGLGKWLGGLGGGAASILGLVKLLEWIKSHI